METSHFPLVITQPIRLLSVKGKAITGGVFSIHRSVFIDVTHGIVPEESKEQLRTVLSEDEYLAITGEGNESLLFDETENPRKVYLRFRILRFLNPESSGT